MEGGYQGGALAPSRDVAAAEVGDHLDTGQLGQQGRVADLHREATCRLVPHGLAVAADSANIIRAQLLAFQQFVDAFSGQLDPLLLGCCRTRQFVWPGGAQGQQLGTQRGRHGQVVVGE